MSWAGVFGCIFPSVAKLCYVVGRVSFYRWIGRETAEKVPAREGCVQLLGCLARPGAVSGSQEGFRNVLDCIKKI